MNNSTSLFKHRYGPLLITAILVCSISFITRVVLMVRSWPNLELSFLRITGIFLIGFFYDLVVSSFYAIPVALYCWLMKDSLYRMRWQKIPLFILFFIITFLLVMTAASEVTFWNEFNVRFNFIAVDYLIYTTEVIGNILESYNIPLIMAGIKGRLKYSLLRQAVENTTRLAVFVMFILIGSTVFSFTFNAADGHIWVEHLFKDMPGGVLGFD